jgi:hypothetical protein
MTLHTAAAALVALGALASATGAAPAQASLRSSSAVGTADARVYDSAGRGPGAELLALQDELRAARWTGRRGIHNEIVLLVNVGPRHP